MRMTSQALERLGRKIVDGVAVPGREAPGQVEPDSLLAVAGQARLEFPVVRLIVPGRPVAMKAFASRLWRERYQTYLSRVAEVAGQLMLLHHLPQPLAQQGYITWRAWFYGRQPDRTNVTKMVEDAVANRQRGGPFLPDDDSEHLNRHTTGEIEQATSSEEERLEITVYLSLTTSHCASYCARACEVRQLGDLDA